MSQTEMAANSAQNSMKAQLSEGYTYRCVRLPEDTTFACDSMNTQMAKGFLMRRICRRQNEQESAAPTTAPTEPSE